MSAPDPSVFRLRDHFLGWQCRVRQHAMRMEGGRPPSAARPRVEAENGTVVAEAVTLLLVKRAPEEDTALFRHMVARTNDPAERYQKAVAYLCGDYYQQPRTFADMLCGLFGPVSRTAQRLLDEGRCVTRFSQFAQSYRIPCAVDEVGSDEPAWQATYWHNALFNPAMPPGGRVLVFRPRWPEAAADPPPG